MQNTDKVYWTISFFVNDLVQKFAGADSSIPGKLYVNFKTPVQLRGGIGHG